jgi:plasmid stabilization system protein ParE
MTSYILSPTTLQDLTEISTYLEQFSPQAAVRFIDEVMQATKS